MQLFHIIEDVKVITRSGGVYRQVDAYRRGDQIYCRHGNGFARLESRNGTSVPNLSWYEISPHDHIAVYDKTGATGKMRWIGKPKWTGDHD